MMDSYHHGDLRRALIAATLELVAENGAKGFTLTEAARRAGVSSAAPYRHFASKDDLLAAVATHGFEGLHAELSAADQPAADPHIRISNLGRAYVRWAVAHPAHYQVMFGTGGKRPEHTDWTAAGERAFSVLTAAVHDGQTAGLIRGADPLPVAAPVWALLHGLVALHLGGDFSNVGLAEPIDELGARSISALLTSPEIGPT
jgi:AcrR family transcriptional regulator